MSNDPWVIAFLVILILIGFRVVVWLVLWVWLWWDERLMDKAHSRRVEDKRYWEHVTPTNYLQPKPPKEQP